MTDPQGPDLTARALAALAATVEDLDHRVGGVDQAANDARTAAAAAHTAVQDLAAAIPALVRDAARPAAEPDEDAAPKAEPWLLHHDPDKARADLDRLIEWLGRVYVHYHRGELAACWLWHPGVIAELIALRDGWTAAHYGPRASSIAVLDWHDRYRPNAARRIGDELRNCSLTNHTTGGERAYRPPTVPGIARAADIADWWTAKHGSSSAPPPTPDMLAEERAKLSTDDFDAY